MLSGMGKADEAASESGCENESASASENGNERVNGHDLNVCDDRCVYSSTSDALNDELHE